MRVQAVDGGPAVAVGVIALADSMRPDVGAVIADLRSEGIERVVMLTGDNERVAQAIAQEAGIDDVGIGALMAGAAGASSCARFRTTSRAWHRWKSGATNPRSAMYWR